MANAEVASMASVNGNGSSTLAQVRRVIVCAGTGCMANGAIKVVQRFKSEMAGSGLRVILELRSEAAHDEVRLSKSGCQGLLPDGSRWSR